MLAMVARSASERCSRPSPKNSTNLPTTPLARSISTTGRTRSVAVMPSAKLTCELEADDLRHEHGDGWRALRPRLRCRRRPSRVRRVHSPWSYVNRYRRACRGRAVSPPPPSVPNGLRQILEIHLVADAGARRHHAKVVKRLLAPAQKRSARHCAPSRCRRSPRTPDRPKRSTMTE